MTVTNRKTIRTVLKQFADTELVGTGKPFQICYKYQTGAFETSNDVSVLVITSNKSSRGSTDPDSPEPILPMHPVYLNLHTFIAYEKVNDANVPEWTEEQSEDAIDDAEKAVSDFIIRHGNREAETNPEWLYMHLIESSNIDSVFMEGVEYRHEVFYLMFTVLNPD